jgi:hypothetical protein
MARDHSATAAMPRRHAGSPNVHIKLGGIGMPRLGFTGIPGLGRSVPKSCDWREAWALFPGSMAYIWHAGTKAGIVQDSLGSPVCLSLATFGPRLIESCGLIS